MFRVSIEHNRDYYKFNIGKEVYKLFLLRIKEFEILEMYSTVNNYVTVNIFEHDILLHCFKIKDVGIISKLLGIIIYSKNGIYV